MTANDFSSSATANVAIPPPLTSSTSSYKIQWKFAQALSIVRSMDFMKDSNLSPNVTDKLKFYGLYKQALEGDINIPRPSSRQVVEYAKWKSWSYMKGIAPVEAQRLYVENLIQFLTEFVHRYPQHEQTNFLRASLSTLQQGQQQKQQQQQQQQYDITREQQPLQTLSENEPMQAGEGEEEEDFFQDAYDPREFELQEHFLNDIEADQIMMGENNDHRILSPPPIMSHHSLHHQREHPPPPQQNYYYPLTPVTSPSHSKNSVTGQWVLNQLNHHHHHNPRPIMDFLTNNYNQQDLLSESDTLDKEVAAITRQQYPQTQYRHPHQATAENTTTTATLNGKKRNHAFSPSSSLSSSTVKKNHGNSMHTTGNENNNNRALEMLQTEITALTEQMDRLRQNMKNEQEANKISFFLLSFQNWRKLCWRFIKILIKHMLANSAILLIVFYILWKRKSPIAYSILNYVKPLLHDMLRKLIRHVVFWKVTV